MNDLDRKIQDALRRGGTAPDPLSEPNLAEEVLATFRGRHRWLTLLMVVLSTTLSVGAVWAALRFLGAESVAEQLRWGALGLLLVLMVSFMKVWFWLEMHTQRVLREVKRVELLLATRLPSR